MSDSQPHSEGQTVRARSEASVATAGLLLKRGDSLTLTVIVKTCFDLVPDAMVTTRMALPVLAADEYGDEGATPLLIAPRELWPSLPECDVTVRCRASRTSDRNTRLVVGRGEQYLLDKSDPVVGGSFAGKTNGLSLVPPTDLTTCQAAPPDQRVAQLHGDEWLYLENLDDTWQRLVTRLPRGAAHAQIVGLSGNGSVESVLVPANSLHVDVVTRQCTLVHRLDILLRSPRTAEELSIVGGYTNGPPMAGPTTQTTDSHPLEATTALPDTPSLTAHPFEGTLMLRPGELAGGGVAHPFEGTAMLRPDESPVADALPFADGKASPSSPPSENVAASNIPGAPWSVLKEHEAEHAVLQPHPLEGTALMIDPKVAAKEKAEQEARDAEASERVAVEERKREVELARRAEEEAKASERQRCEAEKFRAEQEEADRSALERGRNRRDKKSKAADDLRRNMYGAFKRRGK